MWKRLALCAAVVAIGSDAAAQTPAQITATTSGGLNTVTITSTTNGVNADIGTWSGNPYVYPAEPRGCTYFYVDVNVNDGGTLSFKFNQRTWGGIWDAAFGSGSPDEDWLDVYLLTPGTTWNPGTIWSQDGSERCWRQDWPSGVIPLIQSFDFRVYARTCANGTTSCLRQSSDLDFTVSLDRWMHKSVRIVFRQWDEGSGDETQSRVRNLKVAGCPVTPLDLPLTDPDSIRFENGDTVDTANLLPNMQTALSCLQTAVTNAGGSWPPSAITSAWRPSQYQAHFREIWDKYQRLKNDRSAACAQLKQQVLTEVQSHGIRDLKKRPASPNGPHTQGKAVDLKFSATGLPEPTVVQLADTCDLVRPFPADDHVHFLHR